MSAARAASWQARGAFVSSSYVNSATRAILTAGFPPSGYCLSLLSSGAPVGHAVATDRSQGYSSRLHLDRERRCEQHARHVGVDLGTVCRRAHPKAPLARRRDARAARVRMRQVLVMITTLIMTRNGPHASSPWASPRSGASATSRVRGPPCQSRARSDGARRAP